MGTWGGVARMLLAMGLLAVLPAAGAQTVEYFHTDALGTPVAVSNASGSVIERSEYAPYGELLNRPATDGPGFTGHVQDTATGMTYMQQRYYDPMIGRFLSVDPVTVNTVTGEDFNRYAYGDNNPYVNVDPDGRSWINALKAAWQGVKWVASKVAPKAAPKAAPKTAPKPAPSATPKKPPNPDGSKGKPDHQEKVAELKKKAEGETREGERVLTERKIQRDDSNRNPDVQIVGEDGKTRKIFEAERRPGSKRNVDREAEYDRIGVEHETHKVGGN